MIARGIWHFKKRQHEQGNRELFVADSQNATLVRAYDESSPITGLRAYIADGTNLTMKATTNSEIVAKVLRTNFRCWGSSAITAAAPGPVEIFGGDLTLGAVRAFDSESATEPLLASARFFRLQATEK